MPRALSSVSRYSCSGSESATMPPPALKYTRPPRATAVRMAMLRVERAGDAPVADRRRSRRRARDGSSSAMISIARTFGAPVIEPPGNAARSRSSASMPGVELRRPRSRRGGGRWRSARARRARRRARVPGAQTRDRSLRIRSTIIRFSARSFALSVSACPSAASCSGPTPRGRVPLIGRVSTWPSASTRRKRSGEALSTATSGKSRKAANGAALRARSRR